LCWDVRAKSQRDRGKRLNTGEAEEKHRGHGDDFGGRVKIRPHFFGEDRIVI
jgi:hypothetical protein